jgi:hypothetical protein
MEAWWIELGAEEYFFLSCFSNEFFVNPPSLPFPPPLAADHH